MKTKPTFAVHSYPWYVADWRGSETRLRLTPMARYIYREMLDHCAIEGSCPDDPVIISRVSDVNLREVKRVWESLRACFYEVDGRLHNHKIDAILQTKLEVSHKRSFAGKAGGRPAVETNEKQLLFKSKANEKPTTTSTTIHNTPIVPKGTLSPDQSRWFDEFWRLYWRRVAKKPAMAAFAKAIKTATDWEACRVRLEAELPAMMRREEEKRPHPATWLNREEFQEQRLPLLAEPAPNRGDCPKCDMPRAACVCGYAPYGN